MKNIKSVAIKTVSLIVIALIIVSAMSGCSIGRKKIDLKDYITVSYSSFNKHATAAVSVDEDALNELVESKKVYEFIMESDEDAKKSLEVYEALGMDEEQLSALGEFEFTNTIQICLKEDYTNLKNGDKVIVEVKSVFGDDISIEDIEKGLNISFASTEIEYTVSGLEDATEINVCEKIKDYIVYEGPSKEGIAVVVFPADCEFKISNFNFIASLPNRFASSTNKLDVISNGNSIGTISVYLDKEGGFVNESSPELNYRLEGLSTGDEIYIKLVLSGELKNYFSSNTMVCDDCVAIKVPDIGKYMEVSDLSQGDLETFKSEALAYAKTQGKNVTFSALYKVTAKPNESWTFKKKTLLAMMYKYDSSWGNGRYGFCITDGVVKDENGKLTFDFIINQTWETNADDAVKEFSSNCTCEKIG